MREVIAETLRENGVEPILVEEQIAAGQSLDEAVQEAIESADFVLVDVTGANPNVLFELGFARALRKPVLTLVQSSVDKVPMTLGTYLYFVYDPDDLDSLRYVLEQWIDRTVIPRREAAV